MTGASVGREDPWEGESPGETLNEVCSVREHPGKGQSVSKTPGKGDCDLQGCQAERVNALDTRQKASWLSLCLSVPLSKYWVKYMKREREMGRARWVANLQLCKKCG